METRKEVLATLDRLVSALLDDRLFPCTQRDANDTACVRQHEDERDAEGRPVFWFGDGCRVVETFCPSCRTYWHVAVARNALLEAVRVGQLKARKGGG